MRVCGKPGCGELQPENHCAKHRSERSAARGTTTEQGLGWAHQKRRAELLPAAIRTQCPLCGDLMLPGRALDLDHSSPRAGGNSGPGDRIVHASCNRAAGGRLSRAYRRSDLG